MQTKPRRKFLVPAIVVFALVVVLFGIYFSGAIGNSTGKLPPGCVKPAGGFLIIANEQGYNNSIGHGAPYKEWPIITVQKGQTVNITVCDTDTQAHGFQIEYYYDSSIQEVAPQAVIHIPPFVANETGTFRIFCSVFCTVHVFMQNGQLVVQ